MEDNPENNSVLTNPNSSEAVPIGKLSKQQFTKFPDRTKAPSYAAWKSVRDARLCLKTDEGKSVLRPKKLRLPTLGRSNPSFAELNWQPRPADIIWSKSEWISLCRHLHNENSEFHFVMGFRDKDGNKQYVRSRKLSVERAIPWAWSSIAGNPKSRLAFVPYSQNERQQSRWGGLDFDAHNDEHGRARELAFAAFRVMLNAPDLAVILETSGSGGWHVWAISLDFHPIDEWVKFLKQVASSIGTVITPGVCEIFPANNTAVKFGRGMRAPGSWNPGTEQRNEILWQNASSFLEKVLSGNCKTDALISKGLRGSFPIREKSTSFSSPYRSEELLNKFGVKLTATRNCRLSELVGEIFHQVGYATGYKLAELQFAQKSVATNAGQMEHLSSFRELWGRLNAQWLGTLKKRETEKFTRLETQNERDSFRIIRSYARKADLDGQPDFPVARDNLAERLGITGMGVAKIRDKLASLGVITKTADYVPNKSSMRFRWTADIEVENPF